MTQNPSLEVDNLSEEEKKTVETEEDKLFDNISDDKSRESLSTAYSDSDHSLFDSVSVKKNCNVLSEIENTPKNKKCQGIRRRLSLSCKKKTDKRGRNDKKENKNEEIYHDEGIYFFVF